MTTKKINYWRHYLLLWSVTLDFFFPLPLSGMFWVSLLLILHESHLLAGSLGNWKSIYLILDMRNKSLLCTLSLGSPLAASHEQLGHPSMWSKKVCSNHTISFSERAMTQRYNSSGLGCRQEQLLSLPSPVKQFQKSANAVRLSGVISVKITVNYGLCGIFRAVARSMPIWVVVDGYSVWGGAHRSIKQLYSGVQKMDPLCVGFSRLRLTMRSKLLKPSLKSCFPVCQDGDSVVQSQVEKCC